MSGLYAYKDYVRDPFLATIELGRLLNRGALRLFLGAGASSGFGLPEWKLLIARILDKETDTAFLADLDHKSTLDLCKLLDEIDDQSKEYLTRIHKALYRDVAATLQDQLPRSPLLLAVAALITGSCRGRIESVITYNYDDLLEQYLRMLGYAICRRTEPDQLSTRADLEVNYPHGSLPQDWTGKGDLPEIVLSNKSYRNRRAGIDEGWSAIIEHGLYSKIGFFIALSGDDESILDVLKRTQKHLKRGDDYSAYWLFTPDAFDRNKSSLLDVGACPIRLEKDQIASFVFKVCQAAS
jgi:hypothetical protein